MDFTFFLAIYGALLSTLIAFWNVYIYSKDKGNLKVDCSFTYEIGYLARNEIHLSFTITNIGRRDVVVKGLAGTSKNKKKFLLFAGMNNTKLPKTLKPGEYVIEQIFNYKDLFSNKINTIYVYDSLGNEYFVPKKDIKNIETEFLAINSMQRP
ncbi:MAG: hypothetical protein J0M37_03190 [Ignavibacteria bacterium]|nr:hypothetical protein [Ignavibacteria bacterium]